MQRLILFEFHLLGDAVMSLPFLNGARKKYDVFVCCSPRASKIYERVLPSDRIVIMEMPARRGKDFSVAAWIRYLKTLAAVRRLRGSIGVAVWADVRVHLLMLLLGIPQRVGFDMNRINYYANEVPERQKNLKIGESIQRAVRAVGLKPLTAALQRRDYQQHHVEDWRQLAEALGIPWDVEEPWLDAAGLKVPEAVGAFLAKNAGRKIWFLHPGASKETRRWPHFEFIVRDLFLKRNIPLLILDDPEVPPIEVKYENCLYCSRGSVADFVALIAHCDFVLCNDSAASHIGAALKKHVVSIFGSGSSNWFAPYTNERTVIESNACPYRPCLDICVQPTIVCLNDITPGRVAGQIEALLAAG
jgi:ADP-heptose:LPS heptosyltransferase